MMSITACPPNVCSESIPLKAGMINGPVYFTRKFCSKGESTSWRGIICSNDLVQVTFLLLGKHFLSQLMKKD